MSDDTVASKWQTIPVSSRRKIMQNVVEKCRDIAATTVMLQSQGTDNDIIKQATEAKTARMGYRADVPDNPTGASTPSARDNS